MGSGGAATETQDITFDLTPMRQAWNDRDGPGSGTITLDLVDWGSLDYSF